MMMMMQRPMLNAFGGDDSSDDEESFDEEPEEEEPEEEEPKKKKKKKNRRSRKRSTRSRSVRDVPRTMRPVKKTKTSNSSSSLNWTIHDWDATLTNGVSCTNNTRSASRLPELRRSLAERLLLENHPLTTRYTINKLPRQEAFRLLEDHRERPKELGLTESPESDEFTMTPKQDRIRERYLQMIEPSPRELEQRQRRRQHQREERERERRRREQQRRKERERQRQEQQRREEEQRREERVYRPLSAEDFECLISLIEPSPQPIEQEQPQQQQPSYVDELTDMDWDAFFERDPFYVDDLSGIDLDAFFRDVEFEHCISGVDIEKFLVDWSTL